ncbi:MAG: SRPBCC family protein [Nitrososphaera sp.]|jgi:uncharacterized protein YndB with AHSA1/START domain
MTTLSYEMEIKAPVEKVFQYCADPENFMESWPSDVITGSQQLSGTKGEKGSTFKLRGMYSGKEEEMRMMVTEKWPNGKIRTKQTEGPFKKWESIQEFEGHDNVTNLRYTIRYELPRTGRFMKMVSHSDGDHIMRQGLEDYIQNVKHKMESLT